MVGRVLPVDGAPNGQLCVLGNVRKPRFLMLNLGVHGKTQVWLVVSTPLKIISQWEGLSHILLKKMFETSNLRLIWYDIMKYGFIMHNMVQ
jgi:hypothetical protein